MAYGYGDGHWEIRYDAFGRIMHDQFGAPLKVWIVDPAPTPAPAPAPVPAPTPAPAAAVIKQPNPITDFSFTTSAYGGAIPIVFGSTKITGNVIWASDFESKVYTDRSASKAYSYSTVSFAVAICEGPISDILRIWAGASVILDHSINVDGSGVVQPNAAGNVASLTVDLTDPASPLRKMPKAQRLTTVTVYYGTETQQADPTIVAEEGAALAPAYRGIAYVVFSNFVSADGSIPDLFFEVASNSTAVYGRLYGTFASPEEAFDDIDTFSNALVVDQTWDLVYAPGVDTSGGGTVPYGTGAGAWDYNNLSREHSGAVNFPWDANVNVLRLPVSNNFYVLNNNYFEQSVYDPFSDTTLSYGSNFSTGGAGSIAFALPLNNGQDMDVVGVTSQGESFFLVSISEEGVVTTLLSLEEYVPGSGPAQAVYLYASPEQQALTPTFANGLSTTAAHHIFVFVSDSAYTYGISCLRITIGDNNSLFPNNPSFIWSDFIIDQDVHLGGRGFDIVVQKAMVDPTDNNIILFVSQDQRPDTILKWNPFENTVVWKATTEFPTTMFGPNPAGTIPSSTYAFIDASGYICTLDLTDGNLSRGSTLSAQSLPTPTTQQFYDGAQNAITYGASGTPTKNIVKVFLGRTNAAAVPVSDIIENLLNRIGMNKTDYVIDDVVALYTRGYVIGAQQTLQAVFQDLAQVFLFDIIESNGRIVYRSRGSSSSVTIPSQDLGNMTNNNWLEETQNVTFSRARKIELTYNDIDTEYTPGVQSLQLPSLYRDKLDDEAAIGVTVNITMNASEAARLAEILLYSKLVYQRTFNFTLPSRYAYLDPGDVITVQTDAFNVVMRLREVSFGTDRSVQVEATYEDPSIYTDSVTLFTGAGRYTATTIGTVDKVVLPAFIRMPYRSDDEAALYTSRHMLFLTFLSKRPVPITTTQVSVASTDGFAQTMDAPTTNPTWGIIEEPPSYLNAHPSGFDEDDYLIVSLINNSTACLLEAVDSDYIDFISHPQMNLFWLSGGNSGDEAFDGELIQFKTATDLGGGRWKLQGLIRGKFGTAMARSHVPGEKFVLLGNQYAQLDTTSIVTVVMPATTPPKKTLSVGVVSNNSLQPKRVYVEYAQNLRQHLLKAIQGNWDTLTGDMVFTWERGTRYGGEWADDTEDVPLNEQDEAYSLYLFKDPNTFSFTEPATYLRKIKVTSARTYTYTDAMQTEDGFDRTTDPLFLAIGQTDSYSGFDDGPAETVLFPLFE